MNDVALRIVEGIVAPTGSPEAVPDPALTEQTHHTQRFAYAKSLTTLHETTTIFHITYGHSASGCPDPGTTEGPTLTLDWEVCPVTAPLPKSSLFQLPIARSNRTFPPFRPFFNFLNFLNFLLTLKDTEVTIKDFIDGAAALLNANFYDLYSIWWRLGTVYIHFC